ncbi:Uncharacterised protein [uncultured archaeon]|nr:Uncharacterised protein [uncultured archaeon]
MIDGVQFCPKCGSTNIRASELIPLEDPIQKAGYFGLDCLDCNYKGKDFFVVSKEEYKKILKEKFHKKT